MNLEGPHSLGKSIEWKLFAALNDQSIHGLLSPHSLGKSIEWKHGRKFVRCILHDKSSPLAGEIN